MQTVEVMWAQSEVFSPGRFLELELDEGSGGDRADPPIRQGSRVTRRSARQVLLEEGVRALGRRAQRADEGVAGPVVHAQGVTQESPDTGRSPDRVVRRTGGGPRQ